jgi:hypothetical protein
MIWVFTVPWDPALLTPLVNKLKVVVPNPIEEILVEPALPASKVIEPVNLTISVLVGIVPTVLAVTPVES